MIFREKLEHAMEEAEDPISVFVRSLGEIKDFKITSDRDTQQITVQITVQNDIRGYEECLQKQIQLALGFKKRISNLQIVIECIIVSFDITGATHPLQASALALAERFSTGIEDGSILLTDETGNPLQILRDSLKITMKGTADAAVDFDLPMVSIDQAVYCGVTGDIAILKSRLMTSTPITSVTWFRINNDDRTEHAIAIDNKKYFGSSVESPSLVIDDTLAEDEGRYVCHAENRSGVGKSFATSLYIFNSDHIETVFAALQAETSFKDSESEGSSETTSDDDSMTHTLTENESSEKFLTSAVAGGYTDTEQVMLEKGREHYDVPLEGLAAEDKPPPEVLEIHSKMVEELGKRKHTHDSDSETEGNSKRRKRKRKISRDSVSGTENKGRESPQMKENLKTMLALQAETLQTTSDVGSMAQLVTENVSPVPRFDMATDFTRLPEILKLHTDMVQKLGELFPVKGTKWHTILKKVQLLNLLSVADVEEIETMYDLFLSLVQKKDNGITYGEYTSIRTILGTCDTFAEEIIDHYTGLIHASYKDNLETVLALQAETSQRDNQSSISAKTTSDDESMAQLVTEKVSPDNELISAAACGHTKTVTLLLEKGADPDVLCRSLELAKKGGHTDTVDLLLEKGASPYKYGSLPYAATFGDTDTVRLLLEKGADPNQFGVLELAAQGGHTDTVQLLVKMGAPPNTYGVLESAAGGGHNNTVELLVKMGAVPKRYGVLESAALGGHTDTVHLLLTMGADPNKDEALESAALGGHIDTVDLLLKMGGDPNKDEALESAAAHPKTFELLLEKGADPNQRYVLERAAERGRKEIVQLLLEKKADPNQYPALEKAAERGHKEIVQLLLEKKADPNQYPALEKAAKGGHTEIAQLLLEKKADPDKDYALESAAESGSLEIVKLLLEHGADPNKYHVLDKAAKEGHTEIAQLLLENKADPDKDTALESAAASGSLEIVKLLLKHGADPNKCLALELAAAGGYMDIVQLLLEKGADLSKVLPLDVLRLHAHMIKELVEISSDESDLGHYIDYFMKSMGHFSQFHRKHHPTMNDLFVVLKRKKMYEYGEYREIIHALHGDADACKIINYYTPLIKEAFSKKGKRDESRDSDPETEADKSESKQRKESTGEVGQQYDEMQASGSNV